MNSSSASRKDIKEKLKGHKIIYMESKSYFETILNKHQQKSNESMDRLMLKLTFQACDNKICLAPETLVLGLTL